MDNFTYYESRPGKLTGTSEEVYKFLTDIRNFQQFAPAEAINNWKADKESCSFNVSMLGTVSFRLVGEEMYNKIVYKGDAFKENDFSIELAISGNSENRAEVKVSLGADLNPVLKMMAAKPISQFLEKLIGEMEKFKDWRDVKE
jgi:hypothetical protein